MFTLSQKQRFKKQQHHSIITNIEIVAQSIRSITEPRDTSNEYFHNDNNMVKRKNDEIFVEDDDNDDPDTNNHDIETRAQYRSSVKARNNTPEKSTGGAGSGNSSLTSSPGGSRLGFSRKNKRLKSYYYAMHELNAKFASYCKQEEDNVIAICESGDSSSLSSLPNNYVPELMLYMRTAQELKRKYMPGKGDVLTFGEGDFGQLGHEYNEDANMDSSTPKCIKALRNIGITTVSCGGMHNLCLRDNGEVMGWGTNDLGCVGRVGEETVYTPMKIFGFVASEYEVAKGLEKVATWKDVVGADITNPTIPLASTFEEKIVSIATGDVHSLCLSSTGRVYFFGAYRDNDGKPYRDMPPRDDPRKKPLPPTPPPLPPVENEAKTDEPQAKQEVEEKPKPPPKPPKGSQDWPMHVWQIDGEVLEIGCGFSFNAAIVEKKNDDSDGFTKKCITWGVSESGALARPLSSAVKICKKEIVKNEDGEEEEVIVESIALDVVRDEYLVPMEAIWANPTVKRSVEKIGCGGYHLLVISRNLANGLYSVHACGLNNYGQLGLGSKYMEENKDKVTEELTEVRLCILCALNF